MTFKISFSFFNYNQMASILLTQEELQALIAKAAASAVTKALEATQPQPSSQNDEFVAGEFSLFGDDKFTWSDVEEAEKFADGAYSLERCASDMSRCVRRLAGSTDFVVKVEAEDGSSKISYKFGSDFNKLAKMIHCYDSKLSKDRRRTVTASTRHTALTAMNAFEMYKTYFTITAIKFYSLNPKHVSLYHGLYYRSDIPIDEIDFNRIQPFLDHLRYVVCDNNIELYNYILDWVSFIIKNPNGKTGSVLCITGEQGSGKNTFTNVIQEMLHWYSRTLEDIDHILGRWNALMENKKLIVGNEIEAFGDSKHTAWNKFKHLNTEDVITFEEKNEPKRQSENYLNFILVSNNDIVAPIEKTDRRFLVLKVPSTYVINDGVDSDEEKLRKLNYFNELYSNICYLDETGKYVPYKEFYDNLTSFFKNRKYTEGFNIRKLPETKQKMLIQDQFKSFVEEFIQDHYKQLTSQHGILKSVIMNSDEFTKPYRKDGQSRIAFARQLNKHCLTIDESGSRIDYYYDGSKPVYFYKLTPEAELKYRPRLGACEHSSANAIAATVEADEE